MVGISLAGQSLSIFLSFFLSVVIYLLVLCSADFWSLLFSFLVFP